MPHRSVGHFRNILAATLLCLVSSAWAAGVDDDLRQAAGLHKGGDTPAAVRLWEHWAAKGDVDSAYNLAVIHQYGDGVPLDYAVAMRWYRQAADQGDKVAQFRIGLMYQNGEGVEANAEEAHRWFTAHLKHHLHHQHEPKMLAWRQQALALIEERDRREQLATARGSSAQVIADLKRRAGMTDERPAAAVAAVTSTVIR